MIDAVAREAALFAAIGFLIGGIDDLAVDLIFLVRSRRRWLRYLPRSAAPTRRIAIFVPGWDEAAVIGAMLRNALGSLDYGNYRIYVGTYRNDAATIQAVAAVARDDARVRLVIGARAGPTTKGDNLNTLWRALRRDEALGDDRFDAIVLHDAEDVVHPEELLVFDRLLADYDVVQLPVRPLLAPHSPWISGHYADEFAEVQTRNMVVRQALAAGLPLAGVGCAIARAALDRHAQRRGGNPFDPTSLTEDYELGLALGDAGERCGFATVAARDGTLVAVRAYFPATLGAAVRQKSRWVAGIALLGWDRLGWRDGRGRARALGDHWMRMRDRRAPLAMLVLIAAYLALAAGALAASLHFGTGLAAPAAPPWMAPLFAINSALLLWRLAMRFTATAGNYGWREGLRAMPRLLVCAFVAVLAARAALTLYARSLRGVPVRWDKTAHEFPDQPARLA
ncbi:MAG: glycosyl transferase family protein [Pseudomonadota bacterium]